MPYVDKNMEMKVYRRLYLSAIDQTYRAGHDLALGPWCFSGVEDIDPSWEDQSFIQAFETQESLSQASNDCSVLSAYLITRWGEKLNERHGTNYPNGFWWPLLVRWILHTTCAAWRRWALISRFIRKHNDETIRVSVVPLTRGVSWGFAGNTEFINLGLLSADFDVWLYSLCLEQLAPAHWILEPIENFTPPSFKDKNVIAPSVHSNALKRICRKVLGRLPFDNILGIGPVGTLLFSAWVRIIPKHLPARYFFPAAEKPPSGFPDAFLELLDGVLKSSIPECIDIDFYTYNKNAKDYRYVPGRLFVTGATASNDSANFQVAHAIANGERVVRFQHGSAYGTLALANSIDLTEYVMSTFLTWGWKTHDNYRGHFLAVPAPSLCRLKNRHRQQSNDIILVGSKMWLRSYRIDHAPDPSYQPRYRKEKIHFISALDEPIFADMTYRPYTRSEAELEDEAYVLGHFPAVKILRGSLEETMLDCRLLVLDHPGTTLNIALAANVPTICFWEPKLWPYSREAAPYFANLGKAGIIFPDGKSAARHINGISGTVQEWWQSRDVQSARLAWVDQYAHTSGAWWRHWLAALLRA